MATTSITCVAAGSGSPTSSTPRSTSTAGTCCTCSATSGRTRSASPGTGRAPSGWTCRAPVDAARELAAECGVPVEYVQSDAYAAVEALGGRTFDVVYTGKGALCWLPDLHRWARVVAELLRPGGVLYAIDFHPLVQAAADEQPATGLLLDGNYLHAGAERYDSPDTYAGEGVLTEHTVTYEWAHGLDEVLDALLSAGLRLTAFVEHDVTCWGRFPGMTDLGDGWFGWPKGAPRLPLMFSVRAEKP